MQYCSLQHQTLLSPADTTTTEHCFHFGPAASFFLELLVIALWDSGGSVVKNLPAMQETWVWPLGQKDPLEKEMTTYSSILAWEIPWTEEPDRLKSKGLQELDTI